MPRPLAGFVASRGEVVKPFAEADRAMQEERVGRGEIKHVKYGKTNEYLHPEATGAGEVTPGVPKAAPQSAAPHALPPVDIQSVTVPTGNP